MSAVGSKRSSGVPTSFFNFSFAGATVKSATAAAMIAQSFSAKRSSMASRICAALSTRTTSMSRDTSSASGRLTVVTRVTDAPRRRAVSANA